VKTREKSLLERLANKKPLIGSLVSTRSPEVAEAMALCGFEWLFLDLEHSVLDVASAQNIIQAVDSKTYNVIRIPSNSSEHFNKALDTGCDGVIVPMVNSVAMAEYAVRCAKYAPVGTRGIGLARAQGYGLQFSEYLKSANERIALILQIEHKQAVEEIEEIVKVPGVDGIFIGPFDLSASMGLLGQTSAPQVVQAIRRVREACRNAQLPYGLFAMTPELARGEIEHGAQLIVVGSDLSFLAASAKAALISLNAEL
jgi:2-keto-3-deoxy-L-rhamnonate aldolase RhmA